MAPGRWICREMREVWFDACELLLSADAGLGDLRDILTPGEVAARLASTLARLAAAGAEAEQLEGLSAIVERWRESRPSPNQRFLDYRWLATQEGPTRRRGATLSA